ncbi:hypothetical protein DFP72DRAFT_844539 [Ephemerocybe angulata]|uniref:26S proteasome regulatory subunit Rpn6 N-terminal domain-containing protein n=1 Tax=Ephemerocybe angulata TaxID=980116 RepID=A0A8H6MBQ1_9AGAR|nr:hypothetical protein DFP72DRAFT_844539 [Tulosesus angulatus]
MWDKCETYGQVPTCAIVTGIACIVREPPPDGIAFLPRPSISRFYAHPPCRRPHGFSTKQLQRTASIQDQQQGPDQALLEGGGRPSFVAIETKAMTAKLSTVFTGRPARPVRTLLDLFTSILNGHDAQTQTPVDKIAWAKSEKRIFLQRSLEPRLVGLQLPEEQGLWDSPNLVPQPTRSTLVSSSILRSFFSLVSSTPRTRTTLQPACLSARTMRASRRRPMRRALGTLEYMLLCMVMLNLPEDVNAFLTVKVAASTRSSRMWRHRNIADFEKALGRYKDDRYPSIYLAYGRTYALAELCSDTTIRSHLASLYDNLLEQNILRITRLLQMILDKVSFGVDQPEADNAYGAAIESLEEVRKVVQSLYTKTVQIA